MASHLKPMRDQNDVSPHWNCVSSVLSTGMYSVSVVSVATARSIFNGHSAGQSPAMKPMSVSARQQFFELEKRVSLDVAG